MDPQNASSEGAFLAPVVDNTLIGLEYGWPPPVVAPGSWDKKLPLPAAIKPGETRNLVLHIKATTPATIDALELTYAYQGKELRVRNSTIAQIRVKCGP
ncbi:hypothetical protein [Nostocoides japonicum]|uniref:hypothetical protein n=1 Tax=Nostocoides japonicum TaxID=99481 RepID=UPI0012F7C2F8|nr:hypothetical protein [Tetrasphaera japonica]